MSEKMIEHECMNCGKVYWHWNTPHYCPYCNASMIREIIDSPLGEAPVYVIKECAEGGEGDCRNRGVIADLLEHIDAMHHVLDAKDQTIESLRAEVDALKATARWIPVGERLPEINDPVITIYWTFGGGSSQVIRALLKTGMWFDCGSGCLTPPINVTHWRPLPAAPEAE